MFRFRLNLFITKPTCVEFDKLVMVLRLLYTADETHRDEIDFHRYHQQIHIGAPWGLPVAKFQYPVSPNAVSVFVGFIMPFCDGVVLVSWLVDQTSVNI
jgi:hypothetical protein